MAYLMRTDRNSDWIEIYDEKHADAEGNGNAVAKAPDRATAQFLMTALNDAHPEFPEGKIHPDDQGQIALSVGEYEGTVLIDFGKPVPWIGMGPDEAVGFAEVIIATASRIAKRPVSVGLSPFRIFLTAEGASVAVIKH